MSSNANTIERLAVQFKSFEMRRDNNDALSAMRRDAMARVEQRGFPALHDEDWKYTNINAILDTSFELAQVPVPQVDVETMAQISELHPVSARIVFVNGRYIPALSNYDGVPEGVRVLPLAERLLKADEDGVASYLGSRSREVSNVFADLNSAFLDDGVYVFVPKNTKLADPIHVVFIASASEQPLMAHPRVLIIAEQGSALSVVESYAGQGEGRFLTNAQTEIFAGENSSVKHYTVQQQSREAYHIGNIHIAQSANSSCSAFSFALGGGLVRNDVHVVHDGSGCETFLNGLTLADGSRHVDNHTAIDHAKPYCASHETYKSIVDDSGRSVFSGRIMVRPHANSTDAKQSNNNLILSDQAKVDTTPQLEILNNDVKCTHGATIGRLDEEALFYLRSRGIDSEAARSMLVYAFAGDIIQRVEIPSLREYLDAALRKQLNRSLTSREGV